MVERLTDQASWDRVWAHVTALPAWYAAAETLFCRAQARPADHWLLVSIEDTVPVGVFYLLVLQEEQYLELLEDASDSAWGYGAFLDFIARTFPGWSLDAALNPENQLLRQALEDHGAWWEKEVQHMILDGPVPNVDCSGVELCSEAQAAAYCAIHEKDCYWTGERILAAPDRFRVYVAIHEGMIVGNVDVTWCYEVNEPYALYVLPAYRRLGYGRKLLARAMRDNAPKGMDLDVEIDNIPAIRLYESMGFRTVPNQNSITAHWAIPNP